MVGKSERREVSEAVEADKVRLLYRQAGSGSAGNIIVALVMLWIIAPAAQSFWLAALPFIGVILTYLHRVLLVRRFAMRERDTSEIVRWRRSYFVSSVLAGSFWALGGLFTLPQVDFPRQFFMALIACGLGAAAISTLAAVYSVFVVFTVPLLVGMMFGFLYAGTFHPLAMSGLIVLFCVVLLRTGRNQQASIERALRLSLEKDELVRELTEARAIAESARNKAEAANAAKSIFLAKMSHELRTPLHGVLGILDLLRDGDLPQRQRELASIAYTSGRTLLQLLDDLLDLSKIEAEKLQLASSPFALRRLLEEVCALFELQANNKGLTLECELAADLPTHVTGDGARLRQVLVNLLANAVKFTDQGGVTLSVKREAGAHERDLIAFAVRDTGIGVADEVKAGLFDAFQQADNSVSRRYGGTGLGLSIADQLVSLMGGKLELESALGKGSELRFTIALPATEAPADAVAQVPSTAESASATRRSSILIVDDNAINRRVAKEMVARLGHDVVIAESGVEALGQIAKQSFDLVLMDCEMPEMSGLEAAREIQALQPKAARGGELAIVALTAHALESYAVHCRDAGMVDVLTKPVSLTELEDCLQRWIPG